MFRPLTILRLYRSLQSKFILPNQLTLFNPRPKWYFSSQQVQPNKILKDSIPLFEEDPTKSASDYQEVLNSLRSSQGSSILDKEQALTVIRLLYKIGADNFIKQENSSEALKSYNEALSTADKSQVTDSIELGFLHNGMGRIHLREGRLDEAQAAFNKASAIFSNFPDENRLQSQIVQNLCSTAVVYEKRKQFDKALYTFQAALKKVGESPSTDAAFALVAIYDGMGYVHWLRMEYEKAIEFWNKGLDIAVTQFGKGSVEARDFYENLTKVYIEQEEYQEALANAEKCYNADIQFYPTDSVGLVGALYLLGKVHTLMEDYEKARERYEKALELLTKDEVNRPDQIGFTYLLLAKTYLKGSHYDEAVELFSKGKNKVVEAYGAQSLEIADYIVSWGKALKKNAGTMDKAEVAYREGLDVYKSLKNVKDESKKSIRDAFASLGEIFYYEDNLDEALKNLEQYIRLSEAANNIQRKLTSDVYSWIGSIYLQKEDYNQSIQNYEKALKICSELDSSDLDRDFHYRNLGEAYERSGSLDKAQQTYQSALDFLHKVHGADDELTRRSKTLLIDVLTKQNKSEEAEKVRQLYKE